jgi:hypothetical protein
MVRTSPARSKLTAHATSESESREPEARRASTTLRRYWRAGIGDVADVHGYAIGGPPTRAPIRHAWSVTGRGH